MPRPTTISHVSLSVYTMRPIAHAWTLLKEWMSEPKIPHQLYFGTSPSHQQAVAHAKQQIIEGLGLPEESSEDFDSSHAYDLQYQMQNMVNIVPSGPDDYEQGYQVHMKQ